MLDRKGNGNTDLLNHQGYSEQLSSGKVEIVWKSVRIWQSGIMLSFLIKEEDIGKV